MTTIEIIRNSYLFAVGINVPPIHDSHFLTKNKSSNLCSCNVSIISEQGKSNFVAKPCSEQVTIFLRPLNDMAIVYNKRKGQEFLLVITFFWPFLQTLCKYSQNFGGKMLLEFQSQKFSLAERRVHSLASRIK